MPSTTSPKDEILKGLSLLHPTGVSEICGIGPRVAKSREWIGFAAGQKAIVSAWFSYPEKAAETAVRMDEVGFQGIFLALNPCDPALLARANQRLKAGCNRTGDKEILFLKHLLIDIDPRRPSGISSSDDEHKAALNHAESIAQELTKTGWPQPLVASSGNGAHLIYRLSDLPNDSEHVGILKACLNALGERFSTERLEIDRTVFNPSRLTKLYGTMVRKGDHTKDRPHRQARILSCPTHLEAVPLELLHALSLNAKTDSRQTKSQDAGGKSNAGGRLRVAEYLAHYDRAVKDVKNHGDATLYVMERCVFDDSHSGGEAAIVQNSDGTLCYQCFHASCKGRTWAEARRIISGDDSLAMFCSDYQGASPVNTLPVPEKEEHTADRFAVGDVVLASDKQNYGHVIALEDHMVTVHFRNPRTGNVRIKSFPPSGLTKVHGKVGDPEGDSRTIEVVTMGEIHRSHYEFPPPIIDGLLDHLDSLLLTGAAGLCKSLVALCIALAVPAGKMLFNQFPVPRARTVLFLQSENTLRATKQRLAALLKTYEGKPGYPAYEEALDRIATTMIDGSDCRLSGDFANPGFYGQVREMIELVGAELLILDPLISYHFMNENDNVGMRFVLDTLTKLMTETGCSVLVVHHHGKGDHSGVNQSRGASAITDWSRAVLTLTRQGPKNRHLVQAENTKSGNFAKAKTFMLEVDGTRVVPVEPEVVCPPSQVIEVLRDMGGKADSKNELSEKLMEACEISRRTA